jgi:glycosyltransferase involved in cell wall biosynthesis
MKISVVMAVYNGRRFIAQQIDSILSQLEPGDELIAVDDASSDGSSALLIGLNSPYLRVYSNAVNRGVKAAFERGLALAGGEVIFLSDQDDVWLPGKRAAFVTLFDRDEELVVAMSDAQVIDDRGCVTADSVMALRRGFSGGVLATLWRNRYMGCAMAVRRSFLADALPIPDSVPMHDMWLGALGRLRGKVVYVDRPYIQYRRHASNETPLYSRRSWGELIRWRWRLLLALVRRSRELSQGRPG